MWYGICNAASFLILLAIFFTDFKKILYVFGPNYLPVSHFKDYYKIYHHKYIFSRKNVYYSLNSLK